MKMSENSLAETIKSRYSDLKSVRDSDTVDLVGIGVLGQRCLRFLEEEADFEQFEELSDREYYVFKPEDWDGNLSSVSRLVRPDLMVTDEVEYNELWQEIREETEGSSDSMSHPRLEEAIYTTVIAYAGAKDVLTGGSDRRSPGILLEIVIESLIEAVTGLSRGGKISITDSLNVPIDIHLYEEGSEERKLALPVKMSLRERASQPYVHHFLLDAGSKEYDLADFRTALFIVSDYQRYKETVKLTTTPDQISLYQKHLAPIEGFYYLDKNNKLESRSPFPSSVGSDLEVKGYDDFFSDDLPTFVDWLKEN